MRAKEKIGIDFIGFPKGKLGIGEQIRSLMRLALKSDYEINAIDCYHPSDKIQNDDNEFALYISNEFKHPIRIYSITHNYAAALIYRFGSEFFDNKYNIFHFAWEFDTRQKKLDHALKFSDEIWGISEFVKKAYLNEYDIPVEVMPNAIEILPFPKASRSDFNLPNNKFLFCFSFDMNSFLTRKNPIACIQAFKQAFTDSEDVGLVLKVTNTDAESKEWQTILSLINGNNIFLIDEVLPRERLLSLFDCCDSYVSLHRSEGFGIGIAENMLMGKPVICTGYSGNMDFCSNELCFLVDYEMISVTESDYHLAEGFQWADPSIISAAKLMRKVFSNDDEVRLKIAMAQKNIKENFSTEALSKKFDKTMKQFISNLNISTLEQ